MKSRILLTLLIVAMSATSSLAAHASGCGNWTIKGTYAFTIRGQIFLPDGSTLLIDGLGQSTFDGAGSFTQIDAVADNGNVPPGWRAETGTYSVNRDCTGTQTLVVPGQSDLHLQFVITEDGNKIRVMVIDPGVATTAEGERVFQKEK
jgi:hypothetical protein